MLVLSSPSGAGKTTLAKRLLETDPNFIDVGLGHDAGASAPPRCTGATTSSSRTPEFDDKVDARRASRARDRVRQLLRHAARAGRSARSTQGRDVLFDIDWQGTQQLKEKARDDVVSVFILPPSRAELERRLRERAQDTAEVVAQRMAQGQRRDQPLGRIRLRHRQRRHRKPPRRRSPTSSNPNATNARRQTGLSEFVRTLMV